VLNVIFGSLPSLGKAKDMVAPQPMFYLERGWKGVFLEKSRQISSTTNHDCEFSRKKSKIIDETFFLHIWNEFRRT
jgi:hypothetical protein